MINDQGIEVLFVATSDCLPRHPPKIWKSHRLFWPYRASSVWRTDAIYLLDTPRETCDNQLASTS